MELIGNKYKIIEQIGSGSFGTIFKGKNIRNKEFVAIKVEPIHYQLKLLKNEANIYQYLKDVKGIPRVKWFGKDTVNNYLVIQLLDASLETLKQKNGRFSLVDTIKYGIEMLKIIMSVHEKGLIHRDIKPDNFLLKDNTVYLIDFGFCKTFIQDRIHIPMKPIHKLIGSPNYASVHSHQLLELSRRDDLESLGYIMCYLYYGKLEWETTPFITNGNRIKDKKEEFILREDIKEVFQEFFTYVKQLTFEETPDYSFVLEMFDNYLPE